MVTNAIGYSGKKYAGTCVCCGDDRFTLNNRGAENEVWWKGGTRGIAGMGVYTAYEVNLLMGCQKKEDFYKKIKRFGGGGKGGRAYRETLVT